MTGHRQWRAPLNSNLADSGSERVQVPGTLPQIRQLSFERCPFQGDSNRIKTLAESLGAVVKPPCHMCVESFESPHPMKPALALQSGLSTPRGLALVKWLNKLHESARG